MGAFLGRIWGGWKEIAHYIGDFQSRLLLTVFYFTVAVPFGAVARSVGDLLHMRHPPPTSAWTKRQTTDTDLSAGQHQF